jgi:hypothetical protein
VRQVVCGDESLRAWGFAPYPTRNLFEKRFLDFQKLLENFRLIYFTAAAIPKRLQRIHGAPTPFDRSKESYATKE